MENSIGQAKQSFWLETRTILGFALSLLALAEIIDLTIVSVALPNIMGSLGANLDEISLTITSYIVAAAVFIPLTGMVTAKFGVRNVVLVSAFLFGISSVLCGLSTTVAEMVFFRLLQGIGGAFLPSMTQAYIVTHFKGNDQAKMMGIFSSCVVLGPIIGPILGGAISEHASWRWVFYVNVPVCALGFFIVYFLMDKEEPKPYKTDYISFLFMVIGVGCLEYFIDEGNQKNWFESHELIIILVVAIVALVFFVWRGLLGKSVVNLNLFKYRNYNLSCLGVWLFMIVIIGALAFYPTLLQQGYNFPVDTAGYITAPRGLASLAAAPIFIQLGKKIDPRYLFFIGLMIFAYSTYLLIGYSNNYSFDLILWTMIWQGVGMVGVFINLMQLTFTNLPHEYNSDGAGVFNFFRNIGNSVGTSIASTTISHQRQVSWNDMAHQVSMQSPVYRDLVSQVGSSKAIFLMTSEIQKQSFLIANIDVFYYVLIGIVLIAWIPFFLDKPPMDGGTSVDMHI